MGGNIFKDCGGIRVGRDRYFEIKAKMETILHEIKSHGHLFEWFIPVERDDKQDFGDIDILISTNDPSVIKPVFGVKYKSQTNGNVYSFLYEGELQIDLVFSSKEDFPVYKNFISNGDASMIMGRISRLFDLKYGIYGLEYIIRDEETNHVISEINVSKDPKRILEFLGYDYSVWESGFKTEEPLFEFVFSSKYIFRDILKEYSENTKHRKRDRHRDQYGRMYEWFMDRLDDYPKHSVIEKMTEDERLGIVDSVFPEADIINKVNDVRKFIKDQQAAREKFSGEHIRKLFPNISDKDFGVVMRLWNQQFASKKEQIDTILSNDVSYLESMVIDIVGK